MLGFRSRTNRRRQHTLTDAERRIVERNVPAAMQLSPDERLVHERLIRKFLSRKRFEALAGFDITDEVRVTIAAQATLLLVGRDAPLFPQVRTIIVYPDKYVAPPTRPGIHAGPGVVSMAPQVRSGEAWQGPGVGRTIILSWADSLHGGRNPADGRNVVMHEFAHALDAESGVVDGAPALERRACFRPWRAVVSREISMLRRAVALGLPTLLGAYAATNPAELFAVATEHFFERPSELRQHHPDLYDQLSAYYQQDPAV